MNFAERVGSKPARNQGEEQELEYAQLTKRLKMLGFLHQTLDQTQDLLDLGVVLEFHNPPPTEEAESYGTLSHDEPPLLTVFGTRVNVAKELGIENAEAVTLLKDLENEGCLQLDFTSSGPFIDTGEAGVSFTEKGWAAIGMLPDPKEALLEKLETMLEAIDELQSVPAEEKRSATGAVEELKRFVGALKTESALELVGKLPCVLGLGSK